MSSGECPEQEIEDCPGGYEDSFEAIWQEEEWRNEVWATLEDLYLWELENVREND